MNRILLLFYCCLAVIPLHQAVAETALAPQASDSPNDWEGRYRRYDAQGSDITVEQRASAADRFESEPVAEPPYQPVQLLDGFGAIGVGVAEPLFFRPRVWIEDCSKNLSLRTTLVIAPFCGLAGVVEGVGYTLIDTTTGVGDLLTFGYFRLSRRAGVFKYFGVR